MNELIAIRSAEELSEMLLTDTVLLGRCLAKIVRVEVRDANVPPVLETVAAFLDAYRSKLTQGQSIPGVKIQKWFKQFLEKKK